MQYFRRFSSIRATLRFISSIVVDVTASTTEKEINEINKLMKHYNNTQTPIRTVALFEWMMNIINLKPDYDCYLHIIRACGEINNLDMCLKIDQCIEKDGKLQANEYHQLQIKLIYMYGKVKNIKAAEKIFQQALTTKSLQVHTSLFGTMFKAYNINDQPEKTIQLYENEILNKRTVELDAIAATCLLSACSDCHRLDIGEYVHDEVIRLKLLDRPNIRLATAIMDMYCNCGSVERTQELFNQLRPVLDRVAYSTLMKCYLSLNQPVEVLALYEQLQSSSISPDSLLYLNVTHACSQLGLMHQAKKIHRSIPSYMIELNRSLIVGLINMHAHCLRLDEAQRLFDVRKEKENTSLINLLHGYAIHGQGGKALKLFEKVKYQIKLNEHVYRMILLACAFTGGLVTEAREIYKTVPDKYKTPRVAAAMVSTLARASLFDETESFIRQYQTRSQDVSPLWFAFFMVCYHSNNVRYAESIHNEILEDPFISLLFADMTDSLPSKEIIHHFQQQNSSKCWTEIQNDEKTSYIIHEFNDENLSKFSSLDNELKVVVSDLKSVGVDWERNDNDLKEFFCGHATTRLAVVKNLVSNISNNMFQLTKTKSTCHICHEGLKQLSLLRQRDIILKDNIRIHHFHDGQCSCHDQF